jgi:hypothetical protein
MSYKNKQEAKYHGYNTLEKINKKYRSLFKIRTHENLGWHVTLISKFMSLHISKYPGEKTTYWTLMNFFGTYNSCGSMSLLTRKHFHNPNKAIEYQLKIFENYWKEKRKSCEDIIKTYNSES